jgi:hypothetical protein
MSINKYLIALTAALGLCGPASAVVMLGNSNAPTSVVADYSTAGQVSFDLDLFKLGGATLNFALEAADLNGPLGMNALVRNLAGAGIEHFTFSLANIRYATPGSVTSTFGTLAQVGNSGMVATIDFALPETAEFQFGNPFATATDVDWFLDTTGMNAGDVFSITAQVPEPGSLPLLLSGLALAGLVARRRQSQR